jgi:hypothetical protein
MPAVQAPTPGVAGPFVVGGVVFLLGAAWVLARRARTPDALVPEHPTAIGAGFTPEG